MSIGKFTQVQRQVVFGDFVIAAHDATAEQRPERFDGLRMNFAANKLIVFMCDEIVLETHSIQMAIAETLIGRDQIDSARNSLSDEIVIRVKIRILDHLAYHVAFAGDGSDHFGLPNSAVFAGPLALVLVAFQAAKIDLVNLDHAHQLLPFGIFHRGAQSHALIPSRVVIVQMLRAVHHAMKLQSRDAFLRDEHQERDLVPRPERALGILEYRVGDNREPIVAAYDWLASVRIVARLAALADPIERARL